MGLTLLLLVAAWLFHAKVAADQAAIDDAYYQRESYAVEEAGSLARQAGRLAGGFVEAKREARREQEKKLYLEARGILDSVYRYIAHALDKVHKNAAARREVGSFPSGFTGVRMFLEIAPQPENTDDPVAALQASTVELSSLLPAGCSLTVIEDYSRQLFSAGGGVPAEEAVSVAASRDFVFDDGGKSRLWTLRLEAVSADAARLPDAAATAAHLTEKMGGFRLDDDVAWQGWLLDGSGQAVPFGPSSGRTADGAPPLTRATGDWVEVDNRLVWTQRSGPIAEGEWIPAVAVAIDKPQPPLDVAEELMADSRWSLTLGVLLFLAMAGWILFARSFLVGRRESASGSEPSPPAQAGQTAARRRLVRDEAVGRAIPDVQGVIVADIGEDGRVRLEGAPQGGEAAVQPVAMQRIPSGSLFRLQAIHRGQEGLRGSRVLDQAKSPVLRELATRVRPSVEGVVRPQRAGRPAPASMKSATGWKKVEER